MSLHTSLTADSKTEDRRAARVFYDGACPLCRREISHYRRLRGAGRLDWIDISEDQGTLDTCGLDRDSAMARLHVLDAAGHWQTGAWGFAELWSHLPAYRRLAGVLRHTGALPVLDAAYSLFARWRLKRRRDSLTHTAAPESRRARSTGNT